MQSILFTGLFFFNTGSAIYDQAEFIEFAKSEVFIPEKLGNIKLYKDDYGFHIFKNGEIYDIQNCFCDPKLQKMSNEQLVNFLGRNKPQIIILTPEEFSQINSNDTIEITGPEKEELINQPFGGGYISVNQMDDGEYILHAKIRCTGGFWGAVANGAAFLWKHKVAFAIGGAAAVAVVVIVVVVYKCTKSDEKPAAHDEENPASQAPQTEPTATPDGKNPAPQAIPTAKPRIIESIW
jgi:hypothetical protein